jgi:hypothetical protein
MRKLLSSVVNTYSGPFDALVSVSRVNFLLEFMYAKFSMCYVITYSCTYWSWCVVFLMVVCLIIIIIICGVGLSP